MPLKCIGVPKHTKDIGGVNIQTTDPRFTATGCCHRRDSCVRKVFGL